MVKSRLKKSAPECPFECGGGCNCYLGNAQIEVASYKKVLPLYEVMDLLFRIVNLFRVIELSLRYLYSTS